MWAKCDKTRGNGFKLKEGEVEVRCGGDVLSPEAVPSAVGAPSWRCPRLWMGPWAA